MKNASCQNEPQRGKSYPIKCLDFPTQNENVSIFCRVRANVFEGFRKMGNLFDLALWISAFCFLHLLGMIEGISRVIQQNLYIGLLYYLARALYYYLDLSASHNPGSNQNHATILHLVKRGSMKKMMITRGIVNLLDVCMVCLRSQRIYQFSCKFYALREIQKSLPRRCRERVSDRRSGQ